MTSHEIFNELYTAYPALCALKDDISAAFSLLLNTAKTGALIMCCGNGGSAADCEHIVGELMKGFKLRRPLSTAEKEKFAAVEGGEEIAQKLQGTIRAVSLVSQTGLISAFSNDIDPTLVYAQQIMGYNRSENDTVILLSTSGNSMSIVNAAKTAAAVGAKTLAITGSRESKLSELADVTVRLPETETYKIQELTLPLYHAFCAGLEAEMFV